jgi:pyruvate dehydrogenase kinase 2/3/4
VTTVAQGVLEWKRSQKAKDIGTEIQAWLDRFYLSRIGIRFLIGQREPDHRFLICDVYSRYIPDVALNTLQPHPDYVGIICTKSVSIKSIITKLGNEYDASFRTYTTSCRKLSRMRDSFAKNTTGASHIHGKYPRIGLTQCVCRMFKGPPVQLICPKDLHFSYVPGHLSHICFELLKNSLRAVVERYGPDREDHLPPIKVIVVEGKEDITIKISDEGGGIPRSAIPLIWTYMYTTMEGQNLDQDFQASDFRAPMAGFGYGLPLSRLVCQSSTHSCPKGLI